VNELSRPSCSYSSGLYWYTVTGWSERRRYAPPSTLSEAGSTSWSALRSKSHGRVITLTLFGATLSLSTSAPSLSISRLAASSVVLATATAK
jgi:hypothetical protein